MNHTQPTPSRARLEPPGLLDHEQHCSQMLLTALGEAGALFALHWGPLCCAISLTPQTGLMTRLGESWLQKSQPAVSVSKTPVLT